MPESKSFSYQQAEVTWVTLNTAGVKSVSREEESAASYLCNGEMTSDLIVPILA